MVDLGQAAAQLVTSATKSAKTTTNGGSAGEGFGGSGNDAVKASPSKVDALLAAMRLTAEQPAGSETPRSMIYIDPTAAAGGDGSISHPFNSWSFGALRPGSSYLQRTGTTFTGTIYIDTPASAAAPILIGAYGSGPPPVINGSVDFSGASHVRFGGFQMTNPTGASVIIQQDSSNIEIAGNVVNGSEEGVWLGNNAGSDNSIHDNVVTNSIGAGILVDSTLSTATHETLISRNLVVGSGSDGILITSNYVVVSGNTVSDNGRTSGATSGIHVFTSSASQQTGSNNNITGNVVTYNHDRSMQDGNGILLDQWTKNNQVSSNFLLGNDGAGIALYDSSANRISNNVAGANGVDSGHSHSIRAELSVNEALGLTRDNIFTDNTFLSSSSSNIAAFIDTQAAIANNSFLGNVLENILGSDIYQVGGARGANLSVWNGTLGASDSFSGVHLALPTAGKSYDYSFAPGTSLLLDGRTVQLSGWSATGGLFGS